MRARHFWGAFFLIFSIGVGLASCSFVDRGRISSPKLCEKEGLVEFAPDVIAPRGLRDALCSYWACRIKRRFKQCFTMEAPHIRWEFGGSDEYEAAMSTGASIANVYISRIVRGGTNMWVVYGEIRLAQSIGPIGVKTVPLTERWIFVNHQYNHLLRGFMGEYE